MSPRTTPTPSRAQAMTPRAAMAKLESLVIGKESAAQSLVTDNEVTTEAVDTQTAVIQ
jgi:hypothetical protein